MEISCPHINLLLTKIIKEYRNFHFLRVKGYGFRVLGVGLKRLKTQNPKPKTQHP
jgi:hypothetical protein